MVDPQAPSRTWSLTAIGILALGVGLMTVATGALMAWGFANVGGPDIERELAGMAATPGIPPLNAWLLTHLPLLFDVLAGFGVAVVVAAIGLLMRRNWGRLGVLAVLWLGVAVNVAGVVVMLLLLHAVP